MRVNDVTAANKPLVKDEHCGRLPLLDRIYILSVDKLLKSLLAPTMDDPSGGRIIKYGGESRAITTLINGRLLAPIGSPVEKKE